MDMLHVEGGHPLHGSIRAYGSKNTALPLMTAALLAPGITRIVNVPGLRDVHTFANVLRVAGARVHYNQEERTMAIDAIHVSHPEAPYELVKKMRASFYMLGALLGRCGTARVSMPGGCAWGPRPVNLHIEGIKALGAQIDLEEGYVVATAPKGGLPGGTFRLDPSSVGATVNILLAAVTARGTSRIENAAMEPDVVHFGEALNQMGAKISGLGTSVLEIQGVDELYPIRYVNPPDRIEVGTFILTAAMAGTPGEPISITNVRVDELGQPFIDACKAAGVVMQFGKDEITVIPQKEIYPVDVETDIFPGFPTDLQAQWTVLMAMANGTSTVTDTIYFDRFKHVAELNRMGIDAVVRGNKVVIHGGKPIMGAQVMSTDLRGSVALVMAGLVAKGATSVLRVYHLDRGYYRLEQRLAAMGAHIERQTYDEFATVAIPQED